LNQVQNILKNIFKDVRGYKISDQVQVNCPRCQSKSGLSVPDGKFNLEINTTKNVFRCWKCEDPSFSGSLGWLIKMYGTKSDYDKYISISSILGNIWVDKKIDFEPVVLPPEMIHFSEYDSTNLYHKEAYDYLTKERKLTEEVILKYRLGFCLNGKYEKRIIIPSFDKNGIVNYFVARNYNKFKKKYPYLNPKADKNIIFNDGLINWNSTVYLVEGVFDMLSTPNSTPLLGKKISKELFDKLKKIKPNVVILLDPDAFKEQMQIFHLLQVAYLGCEDKVKIVDLSKNGSSDIDEIRKKKGINFVIKSLRDVRSLTINDYFKKNLMTYGSKQYAR
jgi:DNA primase